MERGRGGGGRPRRGGRRPHRGRGSGGDRDFVHRGHRGGSARDHGGPPPPQRTSDTPEAPDNDDDQLSAPVFSKRKVLSNWDRYEAAEKAAEAEKAGAEEVTQRGTDYHVLLSSAGDSFSQFRLAEEKDWSGEGGSGGSVFLDHQALVRALQGLPLYVRLNVEAEGVQEELPQELPNILSQRRDTYLPGANPSPLGAKLPPLGATPTYQPGVTPTYFPGAKPSPLGASVPPRGSKHLPLGSNPSPLGATPTYQPGSAPTYLPGAMPSPLGAAVPTQGSKLSSLGANLSPLGVIPTYQPGATPTCLPTSNPSPLGPTVPPQEKSPSSLQANLSLTGENALPPGSDPSAPSSPPAPPGLDEELDFLLSLEAPVKMRAEVSDQKMRVEGSPTAEAAVTEDVCMIEEKAEKVTAEDLEDWLDSMIA